MDKNNRQDIGIERRTINIPVELRAADGESRTIEGYAAVFETLSEPLWWFREKIARGAFDNCDMSDCVALFNHNESLILARNNNTLSLEIDQKGLRFTFEAPNTTVGNDLLENIRLGNVNKCSFAFTVRKQAWEDYNDPDYSDVEELRTIMEIDKLYDVSPVTRPAYKDTDVSARSLESMKEAFELRKKERNQPDPTIEARNKEVDFKLRMAKSLNIAN